MREFLFRDRYSLANFSPSSKMPGGKKGKNKLAHFAISEPIRGLHFGGLQCTSPNHESNTPACESWENRDRNPFLAQTRSGGKTQLSLRSCKQALSPPRGGAGPGCTFPAGWSAQPPCSSLGVLNLRPLATRPGGDGSGRDSPVVGSMSLVAEAFVTQIAGDGGGKQRREWERKGSRGKRPSSSWGFCKPAEFGPGCVSRRRRRKGARPLESCLD